MSRKHISLFFILLYLISVTPIWGAIKNLDKTIEEAYSAEADFDYQTVIKLLTPIINDIPKDSIQEKSDVLATITVSYFRLGEIDMALQYGKECLQFDEESKILENISSSLNNLAAICASAHRLEEAEEYLLRSLPMEEELNRDDKLAIRLGMLGEIYTSMGGRLNDALKRIQQALELDQKAGREDRVAIRLSQKGQTLMKMGRFSEAESCLIKGIALHRKYKNKTSLTLSLISLATTCRALSKNAEAEAYLKECITIAGEIGQKQARQNAYLELSRLYNDTKDWRAYEYLNHYMLLKDSMMTESVQQQISDLNVAYETQKKEQKIHMQQATIKHQQMMAICLVVLFIFAIISLFSALWSLKLKEKNMLLKDRFVQLISHDLKNPAIAQQMNLHNLLKYHRKLTTEDMEEQLKLMAQAADAQTELLYDLLDWGGLQTGRMKYAPVLFDLSSATLAVIEQHQAQANLKDIEIKINKTDDDHIVKADRQMIATILRNLLCNAIKFTPTGGQICITMCKQTVEIADNGTGFDSNQHTLQNGTAKETGTAIGLKLVQKLAQINHANIEISSIKGIGTRVKLSL